MRSHSADRLMAGRRYMPPETTRLVSNAPAEGLDRRRKGFFIIDNEFVDRVRVDLYAKVTYMVLARHANKRGFCFPGTELIAEDTCASVTQVRRAMRELEDARVVSVERRSGAVNRYFLTDKSSWSVAKIPASQDAVTEQTPASQDAGSRPTRTRNNTQGTKQKKIPPYSPPEGDDKHKIPPDIEDVKEYCRERQNGVNPQAWYDHYVSNGWRIGKNRMVDWQAAVRTWEHSNGGLSDRESRGGRVPSVNSPLASAHPPMAVHESNKREFPQWLKKSGQWVKIENGVETVVNESDVPPPIRLLAPRFTKDDTNAANQISSFVTTLSDKLGAPLGPTDRRRT